MTAFTPGEHRFRFAAWTAARASSRGVKGLTGACAQKLLRDTKDLLDIARNPDILPKSYDRFNRAHKTWCKDMIERSRIKLPQELSYGRVAKLVNVFLKTLFLGQFTMITPNNVDAAPFADVIHPPVDRLLLNALCKKDLAPGNFWKEKRNKGWTNFDQGDYTQVIHRIHEVTNGRLWTIEEHWSGAQ